MYEGASQLKTRESDEHGCIVPDGFGGVELSLSYSRRFRLFIERFGILFAADIAIWAISVFSAQFLRFDLSFGQVSFSHTAWLIAALAVFQGCFGALSGLYRSKYKTGSFDEIRAIFATTVAVMAGGMFITAILEPAGVIPRTTMVISAPIAFSLMGLLRYIHRGGTERRLAPKPSAESAIIFGAGSAGTATVQRLLTDKSAGIRPVAMLDDDLTLGNYSVRGVKVMGQLKDLADVVNATGATHLIVCIGLADASLLKRANTAARPLGLKVLVLPPFEEMLKSAGAIEQLRELSIEDLIGRHPVQLELGSIARYLAGSRVLVTGAGGSIGSELCWQIAQFGPAELTALDRDETGLQQTQLRLQGNGLLESHDFVLADIRDSEVLATVFSERRPQVVFHAAALKHLPMLEKYPAEAWKTNVLGTQNVLEAAAANNVGVFVNISTDKAANPTSVLGHSKRVAEKLTSAMGVTTGALYLSVRFGNVIGSRGSMLPTFQTLIDSGGPITVTDPEVTRFFMTIPEACQLVIQAGGVGRAGEVLILDMGEPVKILEVAQRMIEQSGKDIEIVFTGLRPGEKLHEELFAVEEQSERPFHEKISHTIVQPLFVQNLDYEEWRIRLGN